MKKLDRIILIALVVGVWGLLGTVLLKPNTVDAHADGHIHFSHEVHGVADDNHSHDYADSYHSHGYADDNHSHDYAEAGHDHHCTVDGDSAYCY